MTVLQMLKPHAGLRVLITGGASGIGLVMAQAFIEAGARVHVCDASQQAIDALQKAQESVELNRITATLADVADRAAVERVFVDVQAKLGGLDVLVNNAGIAGPTGGVCWSITQALPGRPAASTSSTSRNGTTRST